MGEKTIRFAVIGTGNIAGIHAGAINRASGAELAAVCSRDPERAAVFAKAHKTVAMGFDDVLADTSIDAVMIATPSGLHADSAVPAAEAGKHILCEKPLDITLERVDRIIDACDRNNVILGAIFPARFNKAVALVKDCIDKGRFGKLLFCSTRVKWFRDQRYYDSGKWRGTWNLDGGGALMNQSIHMIDLLLYAAGAPRKLFAFTDTLTHSRIEVEDNACAAVRFRNGAMGTIEVSTSCAPGFPRTLEISGEKGTVVLEEEEIVLWRFADETARDERIIKEYTPDKNKGSGSSDPMGIDIEGHMKQVEDFAMAVREGRQPSISGREARRAVEFICAVYESSRTGLPVDFKVC